MENLPCRQVAARTFATSAVPGHVPEGWVSTIQNWVIFRVNVGKYTRHGAFGIYIYINDEYYKIQKQWFIFMMKTCSGSQQSKKIHMFLQCLGRFWFDISSGFPAKNIKHRLADGGRNPARSPLRASARLKPPGDVPGTGWEGIYRESMGNL